MTAVSLRFLERSFQGLMQNFNWWINRKDPEGKNVFGGGFLGLDNIGVFDRSAPLPTGGFLYPDIRIEFVASIDFRQEFERLPSGLQRHRRASKYQN